jgi:hypothetical protein
LPHPLSLSPSRRCQSSMLRRWRSLSWLVSCRGTITPTVMTLPTQVLPSRSQSPLQALPMAGSLESSEIDMEEWRLWWRIHVGVRPEG